ncbi:Serine/arginine repetitive matrix protein 2 [Rhodotorula diobovata]|uniref:Serine/arginine repetitive matrix protein 2 n=1 Tax=Rhodotorula diobovata TaxID=5288 RepID=A0A5C5FS31_9BASI|nr:Serine/arginine repetitive matrix protein 2 [Rhodotorula diobovata]
MPAHASTSAAAALQATEANSSTDVEIPPLAFDTEDELHAVLERWRGDLLRRVEERCGGTGKDKGKGKAGTGKMSAQDRQRVEELVMKQFYRKVEAIVSSNCTIAGLPVAEYERKKKRGELGKTQPFNDELHQRVLKYQNDLFDAREINARERVDAPARTAEYVQSVIDLDKEYIAKLEGARAEVPEELSLPKPRSRKSLGGAAAVPDAPTPAQAQQYFEDGTRALDQLLEEVPRLATAAEEARKVALDAAALE